MIHRRVTLDLIVSHSLRLFRPIALSPTSNSDASKAIHTWLELPPNSKPQLVLHIGTSIGHLPLLLLVSHSGATSEPDT
jgi:hypothetical protein